MNKKTKNIILILIGICILIIIILCLILLKRQKTNMEILDPEMLDASYDFDFNKVQKVQSKSDYYNIQKCIETFYNYILVGDSEKIYSLIDNEYIKKYSISNEGIKTNEKYKIDIDKMYNIKVSENVDIFLAYGNIININSKKISDLAIGVKIDNNKSLFSILPYKYLEEKNMLKVNENMATEFEETENLENKGNNSLYTYINDEEYVKYMFKNFSNSIVYNTNKVYEKLNQEYKTKRFGDLENFKTYVNENADLYLSYDETNDKQYGDFDSMEEYMLYMEQHQTLELKSYKIDKENDYTQYILIDNLGNYYIFKETAVMDYTVILDIYTIDLPEFLEKYENANEEDKVILNLQKCFVALNNKDYKYVYNKLDATFKENNFKTEADFEKYIKANFFESNNAKSSNGKKQSDLYTYEVTITDKTEKDTKTVKKTFVMQLNEGTDFVMSFEV